MASSLYEVHNKTALLTDSFAFVQVLADNYFKAIGLVKQFIWEQQGFDIDRRCFDVKTLEADLVLVDWRVLVDGELYHPGAYEGVLSEYANATRYELEEGENEC